MIPLVAYACVFIDPSGNMTISMFPVLRRWFNVDITIMSLTITFFTYTVMPIFGSSLFNAYGRSRAVGLGLAICSVDHL